MFFGWFIIQDLWLFSTYTSKYDCISFVRSEVCFLYLIAKEKDVYYEKKKILWENLLIDKSDILLSSVKINLEKFFSVKAENDLLDCYGGAVLKESTKFFEKGSWYKLH
jgi:hypothetical protein